MPKQITVYISTWHVPFSQRIIAIKVCPSEKAAVAFINDEVRRWWHDNDGDRAVAEGHSDPIEMPMTDLNHTGYPIELWGGESGFVALLDNETAQAVHDNYYTANYDDQGLERPGYLQVAEAYQSGDPKKIAKIKAKQAEVFDYYSKKGG